MNTDCIFHAVTKNGNIFRAHIDGHLLHIHCIIGNIIKSHGKDLYPLNEFTTDLNDWCLGFGEPYGLIIYQKSRPRLNSAGETNSLGHYLETGTVIALVKEEDNARWFAHGAKHKLFALDEESKTAKHQRRQTESIIRECMAYSKNFIPDKDILEKYQIISTEA